MKARVHLREAAAHHGAVVLEVHCEHGATRVDRVKEPLMVLRAKALAEHQRTHACQCAHDEPIVGIPATYRDGKER